MKRSILSAFLAALLSASLAGCGGEELPPPIGLEGTFDLVEAGELLFVTSTAASELRVLNATGNENQQRDFVRAPNPLQPLSIPLRISSPLELVADVPLTEVGTSQYVFARGAGDQISIVGAEPNTLRELGVIQADGAVTAMAAVKLAEGQSRLLYATQLGAEGRLLGVSLGAPETAAAPPPAELLLTLPNEAIVALVALPENRIAVATRSLGGTAGRTFVASTETAETILTTLPFPSPVRALFTNPTFPAAAAGSRVYGLLEEQACTDNACTGIFGVSADGTALAQSGTIRFGEALPLDLAIAPNVSLRNAGEYNTPLLGIVPVSDGRIYLVDLERMTQIDPDGEEEDTSYNFTLEDRSFPNFTFPAAAVYSNRERVAFVAYPSANGILEFVPEVTTSNVPQNPTSNLRGIQ